MELFILLLIQLIKVKILVAWGVLLYYICILIINAMQTDNTQPKTNCLNEKEHQAMMSYIKDKPRPLSEVIHQMLNSGDPLHEKAAIKLTIANQIKTR